MFSALFKIRVRLILGFLLSFLGMAFFVALSYRYFMLIEEKLFFLNRADSILNLILEVRRYEKNYFLYHQEADFQEALQYFNEFENLLQANKEEILKTVNHDIWMELLDLSWTYRRSFSVVHDIYTHEGKADSEEEIFKDLLKTIRSTGQKLISRAEELARTEREGIKALLRHYRILFGIFFISVLIIGAFVVYLLEVKIVKPLHTIEEATRNVAQGDFRPISWVPSRDEIGSLVEAFNRMVQQLQDNRQQMIQTEKLSALGILTSGVAHELNNPLSNISTSCQILLEEVNDLPEYYRDLLLSIEDQVLKARDIVRALLEFSREKDFELKPVDLLEVVEDTLKLIKGEVPAHVEIRVEVPRGIVLELDKARMEQALLNLIMNGIQAMESEGVLTIRGSLDADSNEVILEVIDTGVGIPPEILPKIFDPFFTTKDVGRGTGLGLSVTYGIIEHHGGRISVESKVGEGTRVIIHLPFRRTKR